LLRASLIQGFYSVHSESQLVEQTNCNMLFRWFIGLSVDEPVWDPSTSSNNRDRFLADDFAAAFLDAVLNAD
jgi:transposase